LGWVDLEHDRDEVNPSGRRTLSLEGSGLSFASDDGQQFRMDHTIPPKSGRGPAVDRAKPVGKTGRCGHSAHIIGCHDPSLKIGVIGQHGPAALEAQWGVPIPRAGAQSLRAATPIL
jgi:hypothetical protein